MNNIYEQFASTLSERRVYQDNSGRVTEFLESLAILDRFQIEQVGIGEKISGSHVMNSPAEDFFGKFLKHFKIRPPEDFSKFYESWNGGLLFNKIPYNILSIDKIISENNNFRKLRGFNVDDPWTVIRFADIGHNDFIGYIVSGDSWEVCLILNEYHDNHILDGDFRAPRLATSYSAWIDLVISADGKLPGEFLDGMIRIS